MTRTMPAQLKEATARESLADILDGCAECCEGTLRQVEELADEAGLADEDVEDLRNAARACRNLADKLAT